MFGKTSPLTLVLQLLVFLFQLLNSRFFLHKKRNIKPVIQGHKSWTIIGPLMSAQTNALFITV